jgi:hypothetical protein
MIKSRVEQNGRCVRIGSPVRPVDVRAERYRHQFKAPTTKVDVNLSLSGHLKRRSAPPQRWVQCRQQSLDAATGHDGGSRRGFQGKVVLYSIPVRSQGDPVTRIEEGDEPIPGVPIV